MKFALIIFENETTAVVPSTWIVNGDSCYWPPRTTRKIIMPKIHKGVSPDESWPTHKIESSRLFDTFEQARRKLKKSEDTSDLNTTDPEKCGRGFRKHKKRRHSPAIFKASSSDEEALKDMPRLKSNRHHSNYHEEDTLGLTEQEFSTDVNSQSLISGPSADTSSGYCKDDEDLGLSAEEFIVNNSSPGYLQGSSSTNKLSTLGTTYDQLESLSPSTSESSTSSTKGHKKSRDEDIKSLTEKDSASKNLRGEKGSQNSGCLGTANKVKQSSHKKISLRGNKDDKDLGPSAEDLMNSQYSDYLQSCPSTTNKDGLAFRTSHRRDISFRGADKVFLKELAVLKANQRSILDNQEAIIKMLTSQARLAVADSQQGEKINVWLKQLPIGQADVLREIEKELLNETSFNNLVEILKKMGGGSCNHFVKFVMRKLITDEFASTFSFLGVRGKVQFKSLSICKAAMCAVRTHLLWGNTPETEIGKMISEWLRHANGRVKKNSQYRTNKI